VVEKAASRRAKQQAWEAQQAQQPKPPSLSEELNKILRNRETRLDQV